MNLSNPFTKIELRDAVQSLKNNLYGSFEEVPESLFFQKSGNGWSLAENIQHMNRVTRALALFFLTPKVLASVIFGKATNVRPMSEVAIIYLDALSKGQNAGLFVPVTENLNEKIEERKKELLIEWNRRWDKYYGALEKWDEAQLDGILMPHPFLGKIPAKEMYMIGILHPVHHSEIISKRLGRSWKYF